MSPELWSIVGLVVMFVVGTTFGINLGAVALLTAFVVGTSVAALSAKDLFGFFPANLFVLIAGTTYLFGVAQVNGTIEWLVNTMVRLVRGRHWMLPWLLFVLSIVLATFGPGSVPVLASIGAGFIRRYRMHPVLSALMIIHGAQAGSFSPIAPYGLLVHQILENTGFIPSPWPLFGLIVAGNVVVAFIGFFVFGGRKLVDARLDSDTDRGTDPAADGSVGGGAPVTGSSGTRTAPDGSVVATAPIATAVAVLDPDETRASLRPSPTQVLTLSAIIVFLLTVSVWKLDTGFTAFLVAVILVLLSPRKVRVESISRISWSTVLLVCGVLTYVGLLGKVGTIAYTTHAITALSSPILALLLACLIAAVVCTMASALGIIGVVVPLSLPLAVAAGANPIMVVVAVGLCATVVDVSPFATFGALVLANTEGVDKSVFQRKLLVYTAFLVVLAPPLIWALVILPSTLG
jgi:di/tricarboxylate transporter